jgi:hypothetical protein
MIVEPQDPKSLAREERIAARVTPFPRRVEMLPAVELDDEVCCVADEVDDVWANGRLPAKARAAQAMPA